MRSVNLRPDENDGRRSLVGGRAARGRSGAAVFFRARADSTGWGTFVVRLFCIKNSLGAQKRSLICLMAELAELNFEYLSTILQMFKFIIVILVIILSRLNFFKTKL